MPTYIKKDIVERVAMKADLETKESAKAVNAVFESLRELVIRHVGSRYGTLVFSKSKEQPQNQKHGIQRNLIRLYTFHRV